MGKVFDFVSGLFNIIFNDFKKAIIMNLLLTWSKVQTPKNKLTKYLLVLFVVINYNFIFSPMNRITDRRKLHGASGGFEDDIHQRGNTSLGLPPSLEEMRKISK